MLFLKAVIIRGTARKETIFSRAEHIILDRYGCTGEHWLVSRKVGEKANNNQDGTSPLIPIVSLRTWIAYLRNVSGSVFS